METWKPIVGLEGFYEVSDLGRVRAVFFGNHGQYKPGRILGQWIANGYFRIQLNPPNSKPFMRFVHQLVLESFCGPKPLGCECRHLNGDPLNNRKENLEWSTHSENMADRIRHGTNPIGVKNPSCKLTEEKVSQIRFMGNLGMSHKNISRVVGISRTTVWDVLNRKTWSHIL